MSHPINSLYLIKRLGLELTRANIPAILGNNSTEVQTLCIGAARTSHSLLICYELTFSEKIESYQQQIVQ